MEYDIDKLCELYNISNYTINSDGSIDVNGGVYFNNNTLMNYYMYPKLYYCLL